MTKYERDMKDIEFFSAWLKNKFKGSLTKIAIRDYESGKLLSLEFDSENKPVYRTFDDKYNRMFDIAVDITEVQDYFKMQKYFLKWGFFLIANESGKLYFEKLDEFEYDGNVFSSCCELLEHYGIDAEEFYTNYKGDTPILDTAFDVVKQTKSRKDDVNGSTVFQN